MTELCALFEDPVFYQLRTNTVTEMVKEADRFMQITPNLALKIVCSLEGFQVASRLLSSAVVAMTVVFTASQAYLAAKSGAQFAIPYLNRINRFKDAGTRVLQDINDVLRGEDTYLLPAGIKNRAEALQSHLAGASF
jgi:transaldolase